MAAVALACGNSAGVAITERDDVSVVQLPARPGREALAPVLDDLGDRRLIVQGTDADLAAVVVRLLRTERLADVVVGYLPVDADSVVGNLWGLPLDPGRAVDLALGGDPDPVPLIRDDVGGVLVGAGVISPVRGVGYCDEVMVLRGQASRLVITPDQDSGLAVQLARRRLLVSKQVRTWRGRAFQLGCLPTRIVCDGIPHPRPIDKWTWYRHTQDLRLVRGL